MRRQINCCPKSGAPVSIQKVMAKVLICHQSCLAPKKWLSGKPRQYDSTLIVRPAVAAQTLTLPSAVPCRRFGYKP